jgi:molybdenum cofactor cytidylyltransferase
MPPQVSAIVLAAGSSRRMGRSKQLLPLGLSPVIRHCLDGIVASGLRDIVVVLGADHNGTAAVIRGMPLRTVINAVPRSDMAASIRLGLRQVDRASTGVLICLADHPLVSSETIMGLVNAHRSSPDSILIPLYQGRRGHPTLFPRKAIEDIFSVETLRDVIASRAGSVRTVDVDDEGVVLDLDTPEDYERIKRRFV